MTAIGNASLTPSRASLAGVLLVALAAPAVAVEFATLRPRETPAQAVFVVALDGAQMSLAAAPDQFVLLHFFATWCEPCRDELPALKRFVAARGGRLTAVAISVAEPPSRVADFIAPFALGFPVALDESRAAARAFGVAVLPSTVILAPGGRRAVGAAGAVDWDAPAMAEAVDGLASSN